MTVKPAQWFALGTVVVLAVAIAIVVANNWMTKKQGANG